MTNILIIANRKTEDNVAQQIGLVTYIQELFWNNRLWFDNIDMFVEYCFPENDVFRSENITGVLVKMLRWRENNNRLKVSNKMLCNQYNAIPNVLLPISAFTAKTYSVPIFYCIESTSKFPSFILGELTISVLGAHKRTHTVVISEVHPVQMQIQMKCKEENRIINIWEGWMDSFLTGPVKILLSAYKSLRDLISNIDR